MVSCAANRGLGPGGGGNVGGGGSAAVESTPGQGSRAGAGDAGPDRSQPAVSISAHPSLGYLRTQATPTESSPFEASTDRRAPSAARVVPPSNEPPAGLV